MKQIAEVDKTGDRIDGAEDQVVAVHVAMNRLRAQRGEPWQRVSQEMPKMCSHRSLRCRLR